MSRISDVCCRDDGSLGMFESPSCPPHPPTPRPPAQHTTTPAEPPGRFQQLLNYWCKCTNNPRVHHVDVHTCSERRWTRLWLRQQFRRLHLTRVPRNRHPRQHRLLGSGCIRSCCSPKQPTSWCSLPYRATVQSAPKPQAANTMALPSLTRNCPINPEGRHRHFFFFLPRGSLFAPLLLIICRRRTCDVACGKIFPLFY